MAITLEYGHNRKKSRTEEGGYSSPCATLSLFFLPRLDSLVERFQYTGIDGCDHIHGGIELLFLES